MLSSLYDNAWKHRHKIELEVYVLHLLNWKLYTKKCKFLEFVEDSTNQLVEVEKCTTTRWKSLDILKCLESSSILKNPPVTTSLFQLELSKM